MSPSESSPIKTRYRARYSIPGSFFSEHQVKDLDAYSVKEAIQKAPKSAFGFTIYEVEEPPDLGPDFTVTSKAKNESAMHYLDGDILSIQAVEELPGDHKILVSNMKGNEWDFVVRCRTGNFQPFKDGDVLVAS